MMIQGEKFAFVFFEEIANLCIYSTEVNIKMKWHKTTYLFLCREY